MKLDRRSLLAFPAAAIAGVALGAELAAGRTPVSEQIKKTTPKVSALLARFACGATYESLSKSTVKATQLSILDAIGVSLAATGLEPTCQPFLDMALEMGGAQQSTLFGSPRKVPAAAAALANGALAHALDYEDVHDASGMHPNAAVVPAALAIAEARGNISGREFMAAVAIGCDIACRLGLSREFNLNKYGWYFPPIASAFGATATVGRLVGLNERQMLDAMSLTLCQTSCSSELIHNPDTDIRAIRDAFAAQTAVSSAKLALSGVRGFDRPFEGDAGFATMYGRGAINFDVLLKDLGQNFHGEQISFKAWPACRGSHRYIQGALQFAERQMALDQIVSITAYVTPLDEMLCIPAESKQAPSTAIDAKFSIPFTIAQALVRREVVLGSFSDESLRDADVLAIARRVTHRVDEARVRSGGVILVVEDRAGKQHEIKVGALLGSPENPVSDAYLAQKFVDCAAHATVRMSASRARTIAARVLKLEDLEDMRQLLTV